MAAKGTKKKQQKYRRRTRLLPVALVLLVICVVSVGFLIEKQKLEHLSELYDMQAEALRQELSQEQERVQSLKEYEEYINSQQFIEDVAKDKFGLVYDDEIVIKADEK